MARPQKHSAEKRTYMIRVRLTDNEKKQLKEAADIAGFTLSDHVRVKAIASLPRHRKANPERAALIRSLADLGKIGSNLNQIARAINRRELSGDDSGLPDKAVIEAAMLRVDMLSHHLINLLEHGH
jgi:uncharacterized protein (DUF1778 family)